MVTRSMILNALPAYQANQQLVEADHDVKDIMQEILRAHNYFSSHYDKIARFFVSGDLQRTARELYNFCKANVKYKAEPDSRQTTKSPAAIVAQGQGDCKHYASFIGGCLGAIARLTGKNINWCFRFASYNPFDTSPGHVFVVLMPGTQQELWIDPVLPTFNNRKSYYSKIDKKPVMSLYRVSGVPQVGGFFSNIWDAAKTVTLAPGRNAFLGLVALNVHGFATALKSQNQDDVKRKWESLGGDYNALKNTFESGAQKKSILGVPQEIKIMNGIGEPVTAAALLTAAAGIIAALGSLLKEIKPDLIPPTPEEIAATEAAAAEEDKKAKMQKYILIGGAALAAFYIYKKGKI